MEESEEGNNSLLPGLLVTHAGILKELGNETAARLL